MQTHDCGAEGSGKAFRQDTVRRYLTCDPVAGLEACNAHRIEKIGIGFDLVYIRISELDAMLELGLCKSHLPKLKAFVEEVMFLIDLIRKGSGQLL